MNPNEIVCSEGCGATAQDDIEAVLNDWQELEYGFRCPACVESYREFDERQAAEGAESHVGGMASAVLAVGFAETELVPDGEGHLVDQQLKPDRKRVLVDNALSEGETRTSRDKGDPMNIYAAPGTKIRCIETEDPARGTQFDRDCDDPSILTKGAKYTVQEIAVQDWSSQVKLCEYPGLRFNTVLFEDVEG